MGACGSKKQTIMGIAGGSRGDCQPYAAVLLALKKMGFDVVFVSNPEHEKLTTSIGVGFESNGYPFIDTFTSEACNKTLINDDFMGYMAVTGEGDAKYARQKYTRIYEAIQKHKPDLILCGVNHHVDLMIFPLLLRIPTLLLNLANCLNLDPDKAPFGMPSAPPGENGPIWEAVSAGWIGGVEAGCAGVLEELSGKPRGEWFPTVAEAREILLGWPGFGDIASFMPTVFLLGDEARTPLDRPWYIFTGAPVLPAETCRGVEFGGEQDGDLANFLAAGPPPVYLGWGSMTCGSPKEMSVLAAQTLLYLGCRGVILGGWAKLAEDLLEGEPEDLKAYCKQNVIFMKTANHEALFPRCSAIVHHGGVGTTNASLRSGVPVIVTPMFYDQFDSGRMVQSVGCGVMTEHFSKLTPKALAGHVERCLSDEKMLMAAKAQKDEAAKRDGAAEAAGVVSDFLEGCVGTGKYWEGWDKILARKMAGLDGKSAQ